MASLITRSALVVVALFITACDKPTDSTKQIQEKAVVAREAETPPVIDPQLAAEGQRLYEQNCVFCHQADAIGKPGTAPSLTNKEFLSVASNRFLLGTIQDGRPGTGMPSYAHLGEKNILAIVAYLRDHAVLTDRSAAVDAQPEAHGDPRLGKIWFDQVCLTCHGTNGDGYSAGGTGTAIGKAGFLSKASDGFIRTTIKEGRSNTRMLGFYGAGPETMADLSEREIDDIIAYLRTMPSKN
ncbi:c-type cytochrome [Sulfuriflexus sp.]|uniref:c-type cytochrome n=1 Tax=Sulfuriflexus sp. TaxID=2015443 RepID=UPI0028CE5798|nr:c-type cytochrome [Sulfuriflexus sp.]MDT8404160.1 c-type cytochrome [Sulfuriflexus sp.]